MKAANLLSRYPLIGQLMRFSVTGSLSTLTHFTTVIFLVELCHWYPLNANVIGFICGFSVSFVGHRFFTFVGCARKIGTSLPLFFITAVSVLLLNQGLFYLLLTKLHLKYLYALAIAIGVTSLCTFTISRYWVFKATRPRPT